MSQKSANHILFRSPAVYVGDFQCRPHHGECSCEENSQGNDIVFVRRGFFLKHVGKLQTVANPNHVVFFNRDEPYRISHPIAGGDDCSIFSVRTDCLRAIRDDIAPRMADKYRMFAADETPSLPHIHARHLCIWNAIRRGIISDIAIEEAVLNLVAETMRSIAKMQGMPRQRHSSNTLNAHRTIVECTKHELALNLSGALRLEDLAQRVHASPFHLCRIFRRKTGRSIHQYRLQLRLREALRRIAEGWSDLTALSLDLGFSDHSHLTNAFRHAFGIPPSVFRTRAQSAVAAN